MCVYSMIADKAFEDFRETRRYWTDGPDDDTLRRIKALEDMLISAKRYDEATGQPDCELEGKKQKLQDMAKELGVEIVLP